MAETGAAGVSFGLEDFVAHPRVAGLAVSPDGARLVTTVAVPAPDGKRYVTSVWEIDPSGAGEPLRLTRSAPGEMLPAFVPDGSLLFVSRRPDPDTDPKDRDEVSALWLLPTGGGEARQVAAPPGGVDGLVVAEKTGTVVFSAPLLPASGSLDEDAERRKARKDADVGAILHESYPVRHWDHDLGPAQRRLFAAPPPTSVDGRLGQPNDLTPEPERALDERNFAVSPDGSRVFTGWTEVVSGIERRVDLVALDVDGGGRTVLCSEPEMWFYDPAVSPDGRTLVAVKGWLGNYDEPTDDTLIVVDVATGEYRDVLPGFDLWPKTPRWTPDGRAVLFTADEQGRCPVFRVDVDSGAVTRLCSNGAFTDVVASPDGQFVYALRSAIDCPPTVVRLDAAAADQEPVALPTPGLPYPVPGRLDEVTATAADGTALRGWLVLPEEASAGNPAPLLLWVHGGPRMSWNAWSWRWNPWLMASEGYAVLLPDPALSTGYGQDHIRRGHGEWGGTPYTDLMTMTDVALARPDVDAERTAAMGGSYGGYMANWIAGHTDRFRAIVTHASIWALDQFQGTTDDTYFWQLEFGDPRLRRERYERWSPDSFVDKIATPMLVVHGDLDDRVPIGEALRLWTDLQQREVPARFLFFPDENHWILKPNNARVWYETVFAFLAEHVHGKEFTRPALL